MSFGKIITCTQNSIYFPNSKLLVNSISYMVIRDAFNTSLKNSIIELGVTNNFFCNKVYFSIYIDYNYEF